MPRTKLVDSKGNTLASRSDDRVQIWQERLNHANEYYDLWAKKYEVAKLEEFYYGKQWEMDETVEEYNPYTSNRFFVAIDVKMPSLLFQNPNFIVKPKPTKSEFDPDSASMRAKLRQDMLNYAFKSNSDVWGTELDLALLDAQFNAGIIEVLHSSDWVENPQAGKPLYESDLDASVKHTEEDKIVKQPKRVPVKERTILKRIPANRFRVSVLDHAVLGKCSWFAYWEYFDIRDLENNENYDTSEINLVGDRSADFNEEAALRDELDFKLRSGELVKIWKIYDLRARKILYYPEGHDNIVRERAFKRVPVKVLKFRNRLHGWYPLPITFSWLSPQEEINEIRETARTHRRRFQRKFTAFEGAFEEEELEKLQYGGDGVIVKRKIPDPTAAIAPVSNADLGSQHLEGLNTSIVDFDNQAGVTAQQRGEASGKTATETKILDQRSSIRESRDRVLVANWLREIGEEVLIQVKERTTLDFWIKVSLDESNDEDQLSEIEETWKLITADELTGDEEFDVDILVSSMSPMTREADKQKFIEFLSIVQQFPIVSMSPHLIREAASQTDFRNESVIRVMQKVAQAVQLQQISQAEQTLQAAMTNESNNASGQLGQRAIAQAQPNTTEQIRNQLSNQSTNETLQ